MKTKDQIIIWTDVETAGIKPHLPLLQVAAIATDIDGKIISDTFEEVIYYSPEEVEKIFYTANTTVQQMHSQTGLWDKLPQGKAIKDVDAEFSKFIDNAISKGNFNSETPAKMAGNSIRLDMNFVENWLPRSFQHFTYQTIDVTAIAFFAYEHGITDGYYKKKKTHNAIDDIQESLEEYLWILYHKK